MSDHQEQLSELVRKLNELKSAQLQMQNKIAEFESEIAGLTTRDPIIPKPVVPPASVIQPVIQPTPTVPKIAQQVALPKKRSSSLEDFIGTNLISKVGILITIIGIFIGAKFAIDKNLISPALRIVLAYSCAAVIGGVAFQLKKQERYKEFSGLLFGGAVAVIYFTTYIGYSFYGMFGQTGAFAIMLLTTIAAIGLSLWYNLRVIALLGQVGAYAVPLLLSNGSGKIEVLFTYISIINAGLLYLSIRKNWKIVYRIAFSITWMMYSVWLVSGQHKLPWNITITFLSITFLTFYATYLSYKLFRKELYKLSEIVVLLLNALTFFGLGYAVIQDQFSGTTVLTIFAIANAVVHFIVGYLIHNAKLADKTVEQFIWGQALLFITIAIPVRLDGNWVTLLWSIESVVLIYVANKNSRALYYQIAMAVSIISVFSLMQDWSVDATAATGYNLETHAIVKPFLNAQFLTSIITTGCLLFAAIFSYRKINNVQVWSGIKIYYRTILPLLFLLFIYLSIFFEVQYYYEWLKGDIKIEFRQLTFLQNFMLLVYSSLFTSAALFINQRWIKDKSLNLILLVLSLLSLATLLTAGIFILGEMRALYLSNHQPAWLIWCRYVSVGAIIIFWLLYVSDKKIFSFDHSISVIFSFIFNITVLTLIGNEYLNWVQIAGHGDQFKLGLSIIFGLYALGMVFRGLIRQLPHLRVGGIILFGLTLMKLFFYDLSSLSTISKTIVLVLLGVLLLVASFLYNKYKDVLAGKDGSVENEAGLR